MIRAAWKIGFAAAICAAAGASAIAASLPVKALPKTAYAPVPWIDIFGGVAVAPQSTFADAGAVVAFNHDLNQDGWLARIRGGAGRYSYNRTTVLSQSVDFQTGEFMLGYQTTAGAARLTGYVGANVEHHSNTDPLAIVTGTKWGVKGQGEIFAPISDRAYLFALASMSSAWSSYFVTGKVGYRVTDMISIGPEVTALGNSRFDAVRGGPFVAVDITPSASIILSGGYTRDTRRDSLNNHSGGYGTVHVRSLF